MPEDRNRDYEYLLNIFGDNKIQNRFSFLYQKALYYIDNKNASDYIVINKSILREVILDYFADIERLKNFHNIEKANSIKIASYLAYWIVKKKPLQLIKEPEPKIYQEKLKNINEHFAFYIILCVMYNISENSCVNKKEWSNFVKHLIYHFTYRILTPQSIEVALLALNITPVYPRLINKE
ncbi:MAG: hypothetical protein A2086_01000 [Spirochaetes bacterium GWD1_27_9]|nr:MAG: hypothetical protein A2Z98_15930 [Spirochaetes bacterium GWB1_27_13]OHD24203.1 MAG: hypothetical protein A2Y34_02480 [Spirochaetes bacterium GWC1_27_15]OHD33630.1 MAG: hypothetical protein A2086_01000 [Spirochaetes bacterium GWD1_27_9]